jgi:hypothetical protein
LSLTVEAFTGSDDLSKAQSKNCFTVCWVQEGAFGVPCVQLDEVHTCESARLLEEMQRELRDSGLAHSEVLLSYLKIFLVRATRLKLRQRIR